MSKTNFSRRDFLRMTAFGAAGVVLAGCAPKATAVAPTVAAAPVDDIPTPPPSAAKLQIMWRTIPTKKKCSLV
jgi:hypothetical protein